MKRRNFVKTTGYSLGSYVLLSLVTTRGYATTSSEEVDCNCSVSSTIDVQYSPSPAALAGALAELANGTAVVTALVNNIMGAIGGLTAPVAQATYDNAPQWLKDFWNAHGVVWNQIAGATVDIRAKAQKYAQDLWNTAITTIQDAANFAPIDKTITVEANCEDGEFVDEPDDSDVQEPGNILNLSLTAGPISITFIVSINLDVAVSGTCSSNQPNSCSAVTITLSQEMVYSITTSVTFAGVTISTTGDSEDKIEPDVVEHTCC